jgi:hypothetical protein
MAEAKLTGPERKAAEQLIRQMEHEADQQLTTDPDGAALKLAECRRLRKLLPAASYVHNWPQGQRELKLAAPEAE